MGKYRHVLLIAGEAAERPRCRFPFNWDEGPLEVKFHEFSLVRRLARLTAMSALIAAQDGDTEEAVRWMELAYKIGESVKDEPAQIGQLVRYYCILESSTRLSETLASNTLTEEQARRLYDTLASIDLIPGYVWAVKGGRSMGIDLFDHAREHGIDIEGLRHHRYDPSENPDTSWRPRWWLALTSYLDQSFFIGLMNKQVRFADLPYRRTASKNIDTEPDFPRYAVLSTIAAPVFHRARITRDERMTQLTGSRILLALTTHKQRVGGYPDTLDELRETLGWEIPEDTFSGEDLIYTREGQGFLLYSIGPNLRDDGGKASTPLERRENLDAENDIVWRMEH